MIDFHCHLDLYPDARKLLHAVGKRNIFTLVVTTSPRAWRATSQVFAGYDNIKVAVGLHPEIVDKKTGERDLLASYISKTKFVGEVGIDGSQRYEKTLPLQESIFEQVLIECEEVGGRILSIHSRNAANRVLNLLEKHCRKSTPVLHWFSGTLQETRRAKEFGCWFSVGPAMLRGAKGREILQAVPVDRILPETDGPFTTNHSVPLMPWEAISITKTISPLWGMPEEGVISQIKSNLLALIDA